MLAIQGGTHALYELVDLFIYYVCQTLTQYRILIASLVYCI